MNLNRNSRLENFEISDDAAMADYLTDVVDELFAAESGTANLSKRPFEHCRSFERLIDGDGNPVDEGRAMESAATNRYFGSGPFDADVRRAGLSYERDGDGRNERSKTETNEASRSRRPQRQAPAEPQRAGIHPGRSRDTAGMVERSGENRVGQGGASHSEARAASGRRCDGRLAAYCSAVAHWEEAERGIQEHGSTLVLRDDKGSVRSVAQSPHVAAALRWLDKIRQFAAEFGFTPSARGRLEISKAAGEADSGQKTWRRSGRKWPGWWGKIMASSKPKAPAKRPGEEVGGRGQAHAGACVAPAG